MEESDTRVTKNIPQEAYFFQPTGPSVCLNSGQSIIRFIFYGVPFTNYELNELSNFKEAINSFSPRINLPPHFTDEELLRILISSGFNKKQAVKDLLAAIQWRANLSQGFYTLLPKCEHLINTGGIYFHGRDFHYRPLLVINVSRINFNAHSVEEYSWLLCFWLEYGIQSLMLPGHVENWMVIIDLENQSLRQIPWTDLKSLVDLLKTNYRCRMITAYIVNSPFTMKCMWKMIRPFIPEQTANKVKILGYGPVDELKKLFARHQYEEKYGGSAPNATVFWPPTMPPGPFAPSS
ncbi:unnamed protein product [Blepharisma stoltei]|uniref:CRAL-TRIO domain-containing protein n=1 Tax=Blepharisma stoltei TaxID=1481888 RepID=A0AAU9JGH7_9CILI|nr:unnamed protein product [Blepharisma stoltei]